MKVRAEQVKLALANKHGDDLFLTEVKTGRTYDNNELLKFDVLAMKKSWANPCLYGYEVKVTRADFLQDQKWPGYMAYCHRFAFVCPKGLIQKEELPEEVGLIWYYPDSGALRSVRPPKHRIVDIPSDLYQYILMSRIESDRHPFYSSSRQYFEAWVADKQDSSRLGAHVSRKVQEELRMLRQDNERLKREMNWAGPDRQMFEEVRAILKEQGIVMAKWSDSWKEDLRRAMTGTNPKAAAAITRLQRNAEELAVMLGVKEEEPF